MSLQIFRPDRHEASGRRHVNSTGECHPEALTRRDGCPECVTRNNSPYRAHALDHESYCCHYACACGHEWRTTWSCLAGLTTSAERG